METSSTGRRRFLGMAWGILITVAALLFWLSRYYGLAINLSDSIPYRILWLQKGVLPHKGEWMSFVAPNNGVYPQNLSFTKQVVGIAGDFVRIDNRRFWINGQPIALAKETSKTGVPLALGPAGTIPPQHYFAWAPHPDSFDSRYHNIGWVDASQILGTATPLW